MNNAQQTINQAGQLAEDFDQFLNLLTTQLQNQDPLDPMDSTEFTNQIVQFTQVEQAINTNQKLDDLLALNLGTQAGFALGYVGMDIRYQSAELAYDGETPVDLSYVLESGVAQAQVNIRDEAGELVFTDTVSTAAGLNEIVWDGSHSGGGFVGAGTYTVSIDALNAEGSPVDVPTVVTGRVRGVETQNGVPFLLVGDRAVQLGNVLNATLPPADTGDTGDSGDTGEDSGEEGSDA